MWRWIGQHWKGLLVLIVVVQTLMRYWSQFTYETVVLGFFVVSSLLVTSGISIALRHKRGVL